MTPREHDVSGMCGHVLWALREDDAHRTVSIVIERNQNGILGSRRIGDRRQ
jgi:hypothetical protein